MKKQLFIFLFIIILVSHSAYCEEENQQIYKTLLAFNDYLEMNEISHMSPELFRIENGVIFYENTLVCYPQYLTNKSYTIPDNVTVIGKGAFARNEYIENIVLGKNVLVIDEVAFEYCTKLETISFSPELYVIGYAAFFGCKNLESIALPNNLRYIDMQAFCESGLTGTITLPEKLVFLGDESFATTKIDTFIIGDGGRFDVGLSIITLEENQQFTIRIPENFTAFSTLDAILKSSGRNTVIEKYR